MACVVGLSSLAQVAQFGYASLPLYVLAVVAFLIPSGLMVAELNARMPEEGGFYLWTRTAFGDAHGYLAAWCYWLSNIVWLPTVMLLTSIAVLYALGDHWLGLRDDALYTGTFCLSLLWTTTLLNVLGMERAKWIHNVGGLATWACIGLLVLVGGVFAWKHGSVHPFTPARLVPDLGDLSVMPFFAMLAFSFGGLELAPVMAGEIRDPERNVPRAIVLSSILVGLINILGTLMLIVTMEEGEVGIIAGVVQAFDAAGKGLGLPGVGPLGAILVAGSTLGLFGAWLTGTARLPFVVGLDRYLPAAFGKVHPRWGSPHVSLLAQAAVLTVLLLAAVAGATVKEAYLVLLDMAIILYFIPFLYMFAALAWHVRHDTGGRGLVPLFRRRPASAIAVAGVGFGITLFSLVISAVPSREIEDAGLFVLKVVGGAIVLIAAGLVLYFARRRV